MNRTEQAIYLELLRASLWERTPNHIVFHGDWSWTPILEAFINNDLLGIVANTIALLPTSDVSGSLTKQEQQREDLLYRYLGSLIKSHHLLNSRLRDIMPQLESADCHPVLLKGQGLSVHYPKTSLRSCGDLDIYVGEKNMDKAKAIINAMATKEEIEQAEDSSHHYHIKLNGITYEIHRYPGEAGNKKYQDAYIALSTPRLQPEHCEQVDLTVGSDKIQIRVPSLNFNVWYIFNHIVTHFCEGGVGYRQFCDWFIVIRDWNKRNRKEEQAQASIINDNLQLNNENSCTQSRIPSSGVFRGATSTLPCIPCSKEEQHLKEILQSIGLLRAWQILGGILIYQLGLPKEEFPLFNARMAKKSQGFILEEIMGGNRFRFASIEGLGQQYHGIRHIIYNLRFYYYMSRSLYIFSPWAPYKSMWNWLTNGLTHAFTGKA